VKKRTIQVQQKLFREHLSVVEHGKQARKSTFACFVDFCKAHDKVKQWKKLQKIGMPTKILELLKCIYREKLAVQK